MPETEIYLGDGVYGTFDGVSITLDLRGQDDFTKIVLEPETLQNLVSFAKQHGLETQR